MNYSVLLLVSGFQTVGVGPLGGGGRGVPNYHKVINSPLKQFTLVLQRNPLKSSLHFSSCVSARLPEKLSLHRVKLMCSLFFSKEKIEKS